nr:chromodomain helicase DNA binding protein [Hymenolepis microstoma]
MENCNTPRSIHSEENLSAGSEDCPIEVPRGRSSRRSQKSYSTSSSNFKNQIDFILAKPFPDSSSSEQFEEPIVSWVKIERILQVRRFAPFSDEHQGFKDLVLQYGFFIKYNDQSYWNCSWRTGSEVLQISSIQYLKIFFKRNADLIKTADQLYREMITGSATTGGGFSSYESNKVYEIGESIVEELSKDEETAPVACGYFYPHLLKHEPEIFQRRVKYFEENGVESDFLFPERVICVSEERAELHVLMPLKRNFSHSNLPEEDSQNLKSLEYHEVLVKWRELPEYLSTWETVEVSLAHMDAVLPKYRRYGKVPMDHCRRFLLPHFIRRLIVHLANAHKQRISDLHTLYLNDLSATPEPPLDWGQNWTNKQPPYISEVFGGKLHDYQLEGIRWLRRSYYEGVNTILADEMGLGKTIQIVAFIYSLIVEDRNPGPFLITVPVSVIENWEREFHYWAPLIQTKVYCKESEESHYFIAGKKNVPDTPSFNVLIMSHGDADKLHKVLKQLKWKILVVDEAHHLKNKTAKICSNLKTFGVSRKVLLTGTPLQNNLEELISIIHFMDPVKFPNIDELNTQLNSMTPEERVEYLQIALKGHILRRLKHDVIKSLPKKTEVIVPLSMTPLQKRIYKLVLLRDYEKLRTRCLMNPLLHLQKVCNHPYLMPAGDEVAPRLAVSIDSKEVPPYEPTALIENSAKLHLVMRMLRALRQRGHRVLIFCHLVAMLDLIEIALHSEQLHFERIDGTIRGSKRQAAIDRFNTDQTGPPVFLLSTRAGGEGINLATADTVILFDSDWNPQPDMQALSRAHRIGQMRHVIVYRLVMRGTVEERVVEVARRKLVLTQTIMDEGPRDPQETAPQLSQGEIFHILKTGVAELFAEDEEEGNSNTTVNDKENEKPIKSTEAMETESELKTGAPEEKMEVDSAPNEVAEGGENTLEVEAVPNGSQNGDNPSTENASGVEAMQVDENPREDDPMIPDTVEETMAVEEKNDVPEATLSPTEAKPKPSAKSRFLVYDDAALERLLDRDTLSKSATTSVSDDVASAVDFNAPPLIFRPCLGEVDLTEETDISEIGGERVNWQKYWDDLLKRHYERLMAQEAEARVLRGALAFKQTRESTVKSAKIVVNTAVEEITTVTNNAHEDSIDGIPSTVGVSAPAIIQGCTNRNEEEKVGETDKKYDEMESDDSIDDQVKVTNFAAGSGRRLLAGEFSKPEPGTEAALAAATAGFPRRSSRPPRRSAAGMANILQLEAEADADPSDSSSIGHRVRRGPAAEEDEEFIPEDGSNQESPSEEVERMEDVGDGGEVNFRPSSGRRVRAPRRKRYLRSSRCNGPHGEIARRTPDEKERLLAALYRKINWDTDSPNFWKPLRDLALNYKDVVFEGENMKVYGLNAHDRQSYLDCLMKHGLPPPGPIPPPEWLSTLLLSKRPEQIFSYHTLFMRHLYNDCTIINPEALHWSDGLPNEGVNPIAVLSRVGAMALIRGKVVEFEDINMVPKIFKRPQSPSRFVFDIYEGGLTLLRKYWAKDMEILRNRIKVAVVTSDVTPIGESSESPSMVPSSSRALPQPTTSSRRRFKVDKRRLFSVLMRRWNYRHDYYLLAAISYHGYGNMHDIYDDPRFKILHFGIADFVLPPSDRDAMAVRFSDEEYLQKCRETKYHPVGLAFMHDRLRVLEQALIVELKLGEVILAYQGQLRQNSCQTPPDHIVRSNRDLHIRVSGELVEMGPLKRFRLPLEPERAEDTRREVIELQRLLDDLYADMPGLPASLICDGAEFHQPRFIQFTENQQQRIQQKQSLFRPIVPAARQASLPPNNSSPNGRIIRTPRFSVQNPSTSTVSIIRPPRPGADVIGIGGSQTKTANHLPPVRISKGFVKPLTTYIPSPVFCPNPRAPGLPFIRPVSVPTTFHQNQEDKDVEIIEVDNNPQPPPRHIIVPAAINRVSSTGTRMTTTVTSDIPTTSVSSHRKEEDMEVIEIDKE